MRCCFDRASGCWLATISVERSLLTPVPLADRSGHHVDVVADSARPRSGHKQPHELLTMLSGAIAAYGR